jgi:hypothetical protein
LTRKPAAPGRTRGTVNAYWVEKREARLKRQAASNKRQATSNKLDKPIDLWDKVI